MNDKHSAECVLCFRAFTLTLRRHHCRKCGVLVCSKCSSHRLALDINGSTSKKGARVCDNCYESSSLNPKGASGVLSPLDADAPTSELTASNGALGDLNLTIPSLPPWSYLFLRSQPAPLPSSDVSTALAAELASQLVPIGRLFVRVVRCVNLPSMSSILQSCDAYVSVHFGGAAHRTRIVTNSLNPHFDSSFWFDVHNATEDKLTLNIFDWDALGKNKHIAYLQLTLAQCATMQQRKPVWFDIDHLSLEAAKKDNMKDMKKNKLKQALKKKDREALDEAAQTDEAAKAAAAANDVRVARPRIQLEVQYVGAEAGEFATHLLPSDPSRPSLSVRKDATLIKKSQFEKVPAFDIDILYKDLFRFIALLQPITSFLMAIGPLLWWTTPWHSFLGLVVCVAVCQRPWLFLVLLELLALWGMARALVRRQWMEYDARATDFTRARREAVAQYNLAAKKKEHAIFRLAHNTKNLLTGHEDDATDSFNQNATSVFDKLNPFHTDSSGNALDASSQAGLNSVVTHTLNGLLISFGLKGSLYYYQVSAHECARTLDALTMDC